MAQTDHELTGDVDRFVAHLDRTITEGSVTGKLEGGADVAIGDARMVVRVYERYSAVGGNRVSLSISILAAGGRMRVSAITSGGSTGMFFKVNTLGEGAFLQRAQEAIASFTNG